jgi:glycosyltransferase involved in cell wall biosynthesis
VKILFDLTAAQPTLDAKNHGAGEYAKTIFSSLLNKSSTIQLEGVFYKNRKLAQDILELCKEKDIKLIGIETVEDLKGLIDGGGYDKFYSALPYKYFDISSVKTKFIYTLHGLRTYEVYSDKYEKIFATTYKKKYQLLKKRLFETSKATYDKFYQLISNSSDIYYIVTSKHTLYSYINTYPFFAKKQYTLLYSPAKKKDINLENFDSNQILNKYRVKSKEFFLIINANRWIKNSYRALLAIDKVYSNFPDVDIKTLILGISDSSILSKIKNKNKFILFDYVDAVDLEVLYKEAYSFIYPSLNEGFGYPPLEAMKYGTPVLASGGSAIPEVCGDAVIYFNPFIINEISIRITQILFDQDIREELMIKGIKRSNYISDLQDKMLEDLVDIIIND